MEAPTGLSGENDRLLKEFQISFENKFDYFLGNDYFIIK